MREPNHELRRARSRIPSRRSPGDTLSRQELAEAMNALLFTETGRLFELDGSYIGKLERGVIRWPGRRYRAVLRHLLGVTTDQELGFRLGRSSTEGPLGEQGSPAAGSGSELEWMESLRREVDDALGSATMLGASMDDWERTVERHGRATRYRSSDALLAELAADFVELRRLLTLRQSESNLRGLTRVTAQMAGLMSLTLIKLGEGVASRNWRRTARVAADEAGDPEVRSWVSAQESYAHYYRGDFGEAVAVARHAQALAGRTYCAGVPIAAALEARAHAALGDAKETRAALDRAGSGLHHLNVASGTASAFAYDEAQLRFHAGNAFTHLHDSGAAWTEQARALELYPPGDYLDRTLVALDRASCLVRDGDLGAAMTGAVAALLAVDGQRRRGLITQRATELAELLPRRARDLPAVRELRGVLMLSTERTEPRCSP